MDRSNTETRHRPLNILLVVEAPDDARTVAELIDKVLLHHEASPFFGRERHELDEVRSWYDGLLAPEGTQIAHVTWAWLKSKGVRVNRAANDGPYEYLRAARRAILTVIDHCAAKNVVVDVVVLLVDADGDRTRRQGIESGAKEVPFEGTLVIGVPIETREAWVLNAIELTDPAQKEVWRAIKKQIGVDCIKEAHLLTDKKGDEAPKKVLERVLAAGKRSPKRRKDREGDAINERVERELKAIWDRTLGELNQLGQHSGLSAFLVEAEAILTRLTPSEAQARTKAP